MSRWLTRLPLAVGHGRRGLASRAAPLLPAGVIERLLDAYGVAGASVAVLEPRAGDATVRTLSGGVADKSSSPPTPVWDSTWFEIASLSKPIAAAFALKYFAAAGVPMGSRVNPLLADAGSEFRLTPAAGCPAEWAEEVTLTHLINHTGLGMHYVNGVPMDQPFPPVVDLISGSAEAAAPHGYASLELTKRPGQRFGYSGGGFLVLQHLLELREGRPVAEILDEVRRAAGGGAPQPPASPLPPRARLVSASRHRAVCDSSQDLELCGNAVSLGLSFQHSSPCKHYANGYADDGTRVDGGRLNFPPLAAGALGTPAALADWLRQLALAYRRPEGCGGISHAAARTMLTPSGIDRDGAHAFMKAQMGAGMFVFDVQSDAVSAEGPMPNRWMLHQARRRHARTHTGLPPDRLDTPPAHRRSAGRQRRLPRPAARLLRRPRRRARASGARRDVQRRQRGHASQLRARALAPLLRHRLRAAAAGRRVGPRAGDGLGLRYERDEAGGDCQSGASRARAQRLRRRLTRQRRQVDKSYKTSTLAAGATAGAAL